MDFTNLDMLCYKHKCNIKNIISDSNNIFSKSDVVTRIKQFKTYQKQLQHLLKLPKVEQKSQEWYKMRENLITASDFAQALGEGKFGSIEDIIKKKVRPCDDEKKFSLNNPFFKWGNLFEPVANDVYSLLHHNIKIHEFGLIGHSDLSFFGASPDGISEYGIMLEIKCPYKRKVEVGGEIPTQYYYQIQGQLEVCGLKECDYFECKFETYPNWNDFVANFEDKKIKGVIVETKENNNFYSSIIKYDVETTTTNYTKDDIETWLEGIIMNHEFTDIKFWYLSHYNLKRVVYDGDFVKTKLKDLATFWDRVLYYRQFPIKYDIEILRTLNLEECPKETPHNCEKEFQKNNIKLVGYSIRDDI